MNTPVPARRLFLGQALSALTGASQVIKEKDQGPAIPKEFMDAAQTVELEKLKPALERLAKAHAEITGKCYFHNFISDSEIFEYKSEHGQTWQELRPPHWSEYYNGLHTEVVEAHKQINALIENFAVRFGRRPSLEECSDVELLNGFKEMLTDIVKRSGDEKAFSLPVAPNGLLTPSWLEHTELPRNRALAPEVDALIRETERVMKDAQPHFHSPRDLLDFVKDQVNIAIRGKNYQWKNHEPFYIPPAHTPQGVEGFARNMSQVNVDHVLAEKARTIAMRQAKQAAMDRAVARVQPLLDYHKGRLMTQALGMLPAPEAKRLVGRICQNLHNYSEHLHNPAAHNLRMAKSLKYDGRQLLLDAMDKVAEGDHNWRETHDEARKRQQWERVQQRAQNIRERISQLFQTSEETFFLALAADKERAQEKLHILNEWLDERYSRTPLAISQHHEPYVQPVSPDYPRKGEGQWPADGLVPVPTKRYLPVYGVELTEKHLLKLNEFADRNPYTARAIAISDFPRAGQIAR